MPVYSLTPKEILLGPDSFDNYLLTVRAACPNLYLTGRIVRTDSRGNEMTVQTCNGVKLNKNDIKEVNRAIMFLDRDPRFAAVTLANLSRQVRGADKKAAVESMIEQLGLLRYVSRVNGCMVEAIRL
jgi:hypothetical protein